MSINSLNSKGNELNKYIDNNFTSIDSYLKHYDNLSKYQKDLIDYFTPISGQISSICNNMIFSDMKWNDILSNSIIVMNDNLIESNNDKIFIHPGIDTFLNFFKIIKNYNNKLDINNNYCVCDNSENFGSIRSCIKLFECVLVLITKNKFNDALIDDWYLMSKIIIKKWRFILREKNYIHTDKLLDIKDIYNSNNFIFSKEISEKLFNVINNRPYRITSGFRSSYKYLLDEINIISPNIIKLCNIVIKELNIDKDDQMEFYLLLLISCLLIVDNN
tara:strand:- start:2295 stop:3119 length:825 start_codon:yes stop_codon:yes gene_type:complete